ncbi:hypothetical protein EB796_022687 [Bugula neritina]|uniref:CCHC-type domain-containing protein n=1 Tax=Bugula neritina TaxID=10212 RepID=A0A7J7J010_BUGNE|nr:hypothetical protein EB796_022687 [Bugula neritina]
MQSADIHSSGAAVNNVRNGRNNPHKKDTHYTSKEKSCFRCKSTRHVASSEECPARTKMCRSCGKKGHFARAKFCRGAKGQINSMDNSAKKDTADTEDDIEPCLLLVTILEVRCSTSMQQGQLSSQFR